MNVLKKFIESMKKIKCEKHEYKRAMARVDALPDEYGFVYKKIQNYMWGYGAGTGMDIVEILMDVLELFEQGAADGKRVLEVTGEDVASFCDELLKTARTYVEKRREALNRDIKKKLG